MERTKNNNELRARLDSKLFGSLSAYDQTMQITFEQNVLLAKYNNENSWGTYCLKFFGIPPASVLLTNTALNEAQGVMELMKTPVA